MEDFSVLMSVYKNTRADQFDECMESLLAQTVKASEYVVVVDGEIKNELSNCLKLWQDKLDEFVIVSYPVNQGLGNALRIGMEECTYELVARMDTDDICAPDRFEKQLKFLEENPDVSIVGSNIAEFIDDKSNVVSYRNLPTDHGDICKYLKKRCPFNHMTVFFRKSEVEKAGGYLDWHYDEDSYLWVRMYLSGCKFANISENLVFVRIDLDTFKRRGGYKYYKSERDLFRYMRKHKIIGYFSYLYNVALRFAVYVMMPNKLREKLFLKALRSKKSN